MKLGQNQFDVSVIDVLLKHFYLLFILLNYKQRRNWQLILSSMIVYFQKW